MIPLDLPPVDLWLPPKPAIHRPAPVDVLAIVPGLVPGPGLMARRALEPTKGDRVFGDSLIGDWEDGSFPIENAFDDDTGTFSRGDIADPYIGIQVNTPIAVFSVGTQGRASPNGFINNSNPSITLQLYGKSGTAPSSGTDGTLLGSEAFTDPGDITEIEITSSDKVTTYDYVWVYGTKASGENRWFCSECNVYEAVI